MSTSASDSEERTTIVMINAPLSPEHRAQIQAVSERLELACPAGHDAIALLICVAVAPGFRVAQIVVRFGMPPGIPTLVQSTAREELRIPDQGCALAAIGVTMIRRKTTVRETDASF